MPKRTDADRVGRAFFDDLSASLSCVSEAQLVRRQWVTDFGSTTSRFVSHGPHRPGEEWVARLQLPGSLGLSLDLRLGYRVVRGLPHSGEPVSRRDRDDVGVWQVEPTFYEYRLLGRTEAELLVFHYQPGPRFRGPDHPHIHVSATVVDRAPNGDAIPYALDKRHIATGMVTLAAIVRMLIEDFGAEGRGDWRRTLDLADAQLA